MSFLKRKSSTKSLEASDLLLDVQECCSSLTQKSNYPKDESLNKTVIKLLETYQKSELEKIGNFIAGEIRTDSKQGTMLTLSTLGVLVRCQHGEFQQTVSQNKNILKAMLNVIEAAKKKKDYRNLESANLALQLLMSWGECFKEERHMREICDLYKSLRKKDYIDWPERDHQWDSTINSEDVSGGAPTPPAKPASLRPASLRTFGSQETAWMRKDFDQFDHVLTSLENELKTTHDAFELESNVLIVELVKSCEKIGPQLVSMIEIVSNTSSDESLLSPLFEMNDRYFRCMETYKKISATLLASPPAAAYNPFDDEIVMSQVFQGGSYENNFHVKPVVSYQQQQQLRLPGRPAPPPPKAVAQTPANPFHDDDDLL